MSTTDTKAMQDLWEPLYQASRCVTLLQMALIGFPQIDNSDDEVRSALAYLVDEIESHVEMARATWKQADSARAEVTA